MTKSSNARAAIDVAVGLPWAMTKQVGWRLAPLGIGLAAAGALFSIAVVVLALGLVGEPGDTVRAIDHGNGWRLTGVQIGDGQPGAVSVEPSSEGFQVTTAMDGLGTDLLGCEPPFVAAAAYDPTTNTFAVHTMWTRHGCEIGPVAFRFEVAQPNRPFTVAVGTAEGSCAVAHFEPEGPRQALLNPGLRTLCVETRHR